MADNNQTSKSNKADQVLFSLEHPEYDENTYIGRFRKFQKTCNPLLAFYTNG